jgi:hypothetical protein
VASPGAELKQKPAMGGLDRFAKLNTDCAMPSQIPMMSFSGAKQVGELKRPRKILQACQSSNPFTKSETSEILGLSHTHRIKYKNARWAELV